MLLARLQRGGVQDEGEFVGYLAMALEGGEQVRIDRKRKQPARIGDLCWRGVVAMEVAEYGAVAGEPSAPNRLQALGAPTFVLCPTVEASMARASNPVPRRAPASPRSEVRRQARAMPDVPDDHGRPRGERAVLPPTPAERLALPSVSLTANFEEGRNDDDDEEPEER